MRGHYSPNKYWTNEVWGICALNTDKDKYLSSGDDGTIRLYSSSERKVLKVMNLDALFYKKSNKKKFG